MTFYLPYRLVAEVNAREHWRKKAYRAKKQREGACIETANALLAQKLWIIRKPYEVRIVRLGPRRMDNDNLVGSAKHVRDGIADALGVDDGDESVVRWVYGQEIRRIKSRGGGISPKSWGVRVSISGKWGM